MHHGDEGVILATHDFADSVVKLCSELAAAKSRHLGFAVVAEDGSATAITNDGMLLCDCAIADTTDQEPKACFWHDCSVCSWADDQTAATPRNRIP